MKNIILSATVVLAFLLFATSSQAQKKEAAPEHGTWQLVSTVSDKSTVTVQFFTADGILMYEETLRNVKFNIAKKKTVRRLNEVLKQVHETWVKNKVPVTESDLIVKRLNKL